MPEICDVEELPTKKKSLQNLNLYKSIQGHFENAILLLMKPAQRKHRYFLKPAQIKQRYFSKTCVNQTHVQIFKCVNNTQVNA